MLPQTSFHCVSQKLHPSFQLFLTGDCEQNSIDTSPSVACSRIGGFWVIPTSNRRIPSDAIHEAEHTPREKNPHRTNQVMSEAPQDLLHTSRWMNVALNGAHTAGASSSSSPGNSERTPPLGPWLTMPQGEGTNHTSPLERVVQSRHHCVLESPNLII